MKTEHMVNAHSEHNSIHTSVTMRNMWKDLKTAIREADQECNHIILRKAYLKDPTYHLQTTFYKT
jgi:hypothetical protein